MEAARCWTEVHFLRSLDLAGGLECQKGGGGRGESCDLCEAGSHVSTRAEQQQARKKESRKLGEFKKSLGRRR